MILLPDLLVLLVLLVFYGKIKLLKVEELYSLNTLHSLEFTVSMPVVSPFISLNSKIVSKLYESIPPCTPYICYWDSFAIIKFVFYYIYLLLWPESPELFECWIC